MPGPSTTFEEGPPDGRPFTGHPSIILSLSRPISDPNNKIDRQVARQTGKGFMWFQIHGVHFLYQPCPDLPPSMLCACLHSTLRVTTFSPLATPEPCSPGPLSLPRLLLKQDVGVSQYLWISHVTKQLRHRCVLSCLLFLLL